MIKKKGFSSHGGHVMSRLRCNLGKFLVQSDPVKSTVKRKV